MKLAYRTLLILSILSLSPCFVARGVRVNVTFNGRHSHGLEPGQHSTQARYWSPSMFGYSLSNLPRAWNSNTKTAFLGVMAAQLWLHNKVYDNNHMYLTQFLNPFNILLHPIRLVDDGLIGHIGHGKNSCYGALGTAMALVPKVDQAIVKVDNAKRKVEAWFDWFHRNLTTLN